MAIFKANFCKRGKTERSLAKASIRYILKCCSNFGIAPIIDNKTTSCRVRIPVKPAITGLHNEVLILHGV